MSQNLTGLMHWIALASITGAALLLGLVWVYDLLWFRIPNWVVCGLVFSFGMYGFSTGLETQAWLLHVGVGLAALALGLCLFQFGIMGAGDGKLIAVCALWTGIEHVATFLVTMAILGGLLTVFLLITHAIGRRMPNSGLKQWQLAQSIFYAKNVPYGLAISASMLMLLWVEYWPNV